MLEVAEVVKRRDLRAFIALPYRLYRNDPNFVPPLYAQMKSILLGKHNILLGNGPHALFLVKKDGRCVGRILVGIDQAYNQENGYNSAWFSLFDCEHDEEAAAALLAAIEQWARQRQMDYLRGPEAPDSGDSYKGILVMGFDGPPAMLNSYNPPWYGDFFEQQGYRKNLDLFAFFLTADNVKAHNAEKVIQYAMNKFGYHVDCLDRNHLERDLQDIHTILVRTIPTWQDEHMAIPTLDDVRRFTREMLPLADQELVCIARTNIDDQPIGVVVALPDYNQALRHVRNGRLFPFGFFKLLYYRRRLTSIRIFMQFVVPEYQGKAVNNAIFFKMYNAALVKGYRTADGSTIGETNRQSRLSVEKLGGVHYRTYRMYKKKLNS